VPPNPGPQALVKENAFEVTNRGYTIVYGNLNKIGPDGTPFIDPTNPSLNSNNVSPKVADPAIFGATYQDNTIIAWGDVPASVPGPVTPTSSFGVMSITRSATPVNEYLVTLNNTPSDTDPNTNAAITQASITATPSYPFTSTNNVCLQIVVSQINNNQFKVWTYRNCEASAEAFMFKVVGRR
jgi:hypothetical protein